MIITVEGQKYDITNWNEFQEKLLDALGFSITNAIDEQITQLRIVDKGAGGGLLGSYEHRVDGNKLIIFSNRPHAAYIEWGTAGAISVKPDPFGESLSVNPSRKYPMKYLGTLNGKKQFDLVPGLKDWARRKGIPEQAYFGLAKHIRDYGMTPYAPVRRVLYNESMMEDVLQTAIRWAAK